MTGRNHRRGYTSTGLSITAGDARYLMLDCSNDPLTNDLDLGLNLIKSTGGIHMGELAADPGATGAGSGTFWTRSDAPTVPMFTDDAGTDHNLLDVSTGPWDVAAGIVYPDTYATDDVVIGANTMTGGERLKVVGSVLFDGALLMSSTSAIYYGDVNRSTVDDGTNLIKTNTTGYTRHIAKDALASTWRVTNEADTIHYICVDSTVPNIVLGCTAGVNIFEIVATGANLIGSLDINNVLADPAGDMAIIQIDPSGSQTGGGSVRGIMIQPTQTLNNAATGFDAFYANMAGATYTSFANAYGFRAVMDGAYPAGTTMAAANLQGDGRTAELCNNLYAGEFTGDVLITGKLTVTGAIDPTCLILNEQASIPIAAVGGTGTIYTKSDAPTTLWFADDTGDEYQVANPHPDRYFEINVVESGTALTVADGIVGVTIPDDMNGYIIDDARVSATVAGVTSGSNDFQVRRQRAGAAVDMLSTEVTLAYGDYTVADGVIDADNDDVNTGDMIYVDCNAISGTAANGVTLVLKFVYEG